MWGKPYKYKGDGSVTLNRKWRKVGRNEMCPCGSYFKYKNCCGKNPVTDPIAWYLPYLVVAVIMLIVYLITL